MFLYLAEIPWEAHAIGKKGKIAHKNVPESDELVLSIFIYFKRLFVLENFDLF